MARRLLIALVLLAALFLVACAPSGQSVEPSAPLPTATLPPQLGVPIPVSDPVYKPLPQTTEIVPNCGGGSEPVVKHPSLTTVSLNSVEWEVGGQFGAGLRVQPPGFPVGVDLSAVIEVADRTKLEQNLQQGVAWDLPAAPGEIMTYVLSWEELWQLATVEVDFGNQDMRQINVNYRTSIKSNIVDSNRQECGTPRPGDGTVSLLPTTEVSQPTTELSQQLQLTPSQPEDSAAGPQREHFSVVVGTGVFEQGTFSDGQLQLTEQMLWDNDYFDIQRIRREEYPNGCDAARYTTDWIWIGGGPGMRLTINGQDVGQYTIAPDAHGYMFNLPVKIGDQICAVDIAPEGFQIIIGPDIYYHYDS